MNRKHLLYVENISPSSSEQHLIDYLEKWAPVQQVYFLRDRQCTKRSIAAFVRVANESDLDLLMLRNQQNYRGKRLFMMRCDKTEFFQADHTVIVRNITAKISEENLFDHFEECGKIAFLQIRTDDFAYIGFEDKASVKNAMNKNNMPLKGSNLKIQLLTRNIEVMIVNLDTLQARVPDLYRKLVMPVEPRQAGGTQQQQQKGPPQQQQSQQQQKQQPQQQQQQSRNQQQQQSGNQRQQPQNQRQQQQPQQQQQQQQQRGQPQQQRQPQQQFQPQRQQQQPQPQRQQQQSQPQWQQQQPQPQRQQMSTIQLLKEKANAMQQQQQHKPQQQAKPAPTVQAQQPRNQSTPKPVPPPAPAVVTSTPYAAPAPKMVTEEPPEDTDDVQIVEPMDTTEILDESDTEIQVVRETAGVPPMPSKYKPQSNDVMRPIKASEIAMSPAQVKSDKDVRSVWINHIPPETSRLELVLYLEQFGDVESCKIGSSNNCYFTRWAKVCFISEEGAKRAAEYFLHPFQGHYLFVLACTRCIDEVPGKVFVLDYLSKFLIYEDVAKAFKHVGNVYYLVRLLDNTYKVRIFFLETVDVEAALAVKSIDGKPITVELHAEGKDLKLPKEIASQLKKEREIMDPAKEARMTRILEIFKEEALNRCDPVVNPAGKTEGNVALLTNVPSATTKQQILDFLKPAGYPVFIRREKEQFNEGCDRVFAGFRTLSMVLKAAELSTHEHMLNDHKPFIFPAWTKPHMTEKNTLKFTFSAKGEIAVQDVYNGLIHFGPIRYIEMNSGKSALVVFDSHYNGMNNCKIPQGTFIGPVRVVNKEKFRQELKGPCNPCNIWYNEEIAHLRRIVMSTRRRMSRHRLEENKERFYEARRNQKLAIRRAKFTIAEHAENFNGDASGDESIKALQTALGLSIEPEPYDPTGKSDQPGDSIVIDDDDDDDDDDDVEAVSEGSPKKNVQPNQNKKDSNNKNQGNQPKPQNQQQQQRRREPPQRRQQQQNQQQQRFGRDRNDGPQQQQQRHHPYNQQQQRQGQHRSMSPRRENRAPWNDPQIRQQLDQQQIMPDHRFNIEDNGPFDRFGPGNRNMDQREMNQFHQMNQMNRFDQMMSQEFGNFSINQQQQFDNEFNRGGGGPLDSDDPPLNRGGWGGGHPHHQQQQHFNRFSPPRERSPFDRGGFRDDDDLDFGRDSPGIPPNIPDEEIDEYIMRKQEAIKRRLAQLDKQLISSVESSRHRDYQQQTQRQRQREGTVFSDNGDVHYVPNPAAMARNRGDRRGGGGPGGFGRGRGRGGGGGGRGHGREDARGGPRQSQERAYLSQERQGSRDRTRREDTRRKDPFADVDIVPIIRISEERSPSPKRSREESFDQAQFDAAWS